jgi:nucleotide-binding universal stress UspA family protein
MKKVLIPVDDTKGSEAILSVFSNLVKPPEEIILLHVEKPGGKSLMYDMLGDAEMSTLKEMLEGTEYKEKLDKRAEKILTYYKKRLNHGGLVNIKTVVRMGHPADEILKVAEEENAELMILGCNGKDKLHKLITGCVTKDVEKRAHVPVLVAKSRGCEKGVEHCVRGEAYVAE